MRLGDVRAMLLKVFGKDISQERLRRYEDDGLIKFDREESSSYRICTSEMLDEIVNIIALIETGVSIDALKNKDIEAVSNHINYAKKIVPKLHIPKEWR